MDNLFGKKTIPFIKNKAVPGRIFTADSNTLTAGKGIVDRKEELSINVAGVEARIGYGGRGQITDVQLPLRPAGAGCAVAV